MVSLSEIAATRPRSRHRPVSSALRTRYVSKTPSFLQQHPFLVSCRQKASVPTNSLHPLSSEHGCMHLHTRPSANGSVWSIWLPNSGACEDTSNFHGSAGEPDEVHVYSGRKDGIHRPQKHRSNIDTASRLGEENIYVPYSRSGHDEKCDYAVSIEKDEEWRASS